jgi:enamine deaminase RidA (YjgF/YER057c/UK114 family)
MEIRTMAKKKKTRRQQPRQQPVEKKESNFWKITAIIAVVLLAGVTAKSLFSPSQNTTPITPIQATSSQPIPIQPITGQSPAVQKATSTATNSIEDQVRQVALNFKCACEGCGELPLAECQCDMPKGAVEEKSFIRTKLTEGYTVPQVIELVDKKYGFRV